MTLTALQTEQLELCALMVRKACIITTQIAHSNISYTAIVPRPCSDGDIQFGNPIYFGIFEGYNFDGGRVEVCINGTFRPVCDADWSNQDASVVCNGLAISFNRIRKL